MASGIYARIQVDGNAVPGTHGAMIIGGVDVSEAEWFRCSDVTYGAIEVPSKELTVPGRHELEGVFIVCREGPSTPLLLQALDKNASVTATIAFFRPAPNGVEQQYMQVQGQEGRMTSVHITASTVGDDSRSQHLACRFQRLSIESIGANALAVEID